MNSFMWVFFFLIEVHDVESIGLCDLFSYYPFTFEVSSMNLDLLN
jgi:hypothetical protein